MVHLVFLSLWLAHPNPEALKVEARALSKASGCTQADQCKALPLGSKPCGGPSEYVIYCSVSTDVRALEAKAKQANDAEQAMNAAHQAMGICTALSPPKVKLEQGQCGALETKRADVPM